MEQAENTQQDDLAEGLLAGKKQLEASIKAGKPAPTGDLKSLALKNVHLRPDVYQHRSGHQAASEYHSNELAKALLRNPTQALDPITVYWIGDRWVCIDGHHRIAAYKKAKYTANIPVRVFKGSLEASIGEALRGNAKDKLAYSRNEKSTAAWRVVISTPSLTREEQVRISTASLSTIKTMRRVARELTKSHPDLPLDSLRWWQARDLAKGLIPKPDTGIDERKEAKIMLLTNLLCKHFGTRLTEDIDITVEALLRFNQELPSAIADAMRLKAMDDEEDVLLEDEFGIGNDGEPEF